MPAPEADVMTRLEWWVNESNDRGVSSFTIAHAIGKVPWTAFSKNGGWYADAPYDSDDFGRCFRLLQLIPEWHDRLPEVVQYCPRFKPIIALWNELCRLYKTNKVRCTEEIRNLRQ